MKFGYTIIYVEDVPATVAFYEAAFGLTIEYMHESSAYAQMATGATSLAFASESLAVSNGITIKPNRLGQAAAGIEIAFVTKDVVHAFQKAVQAGAHEVSAPVQKPWGQTVAYVTDTNGVLVELCSPLGE